MLNWIQPFSIFLFLDSNDYRLKYSRYECLLAVNAMQYFSEEENVLSKLQHFQREEKDWLFGHICYDFKNCVEPKLYTTAEKKFGWKDIFFFRPSIVCYIKKGEQELTIETFDEEPDDVFRKIFETTISTEGALPEIVFQQRTSAETYRKSLERIRTHIADGDFYEMNYCCEGFADDVVVSPLAVFLKLNRISPAPYAAFYRNGDDYLMCASPECYLMKEGRTIRSMPIKGTIKRVMNEADDFARKEILKNSGKERAENVMIVDLVRNDFARSCVLGSVCVEELFGVYSFPQVHHLISTVRGELLDRGECANAIRHSFPMGSMTGAPKMKVMELTDMYEEARRELFSGSVGYFSPDGDFDLNVVIRSLFYNRVQRILSYQTGGAITYDSRVEGEYDEMRLKAWALERVFKKTTDEH